MSDKSEDELESNRVLEYYKKFSLNPDLSKYFTGPEASLIKKPSTSRQTYTEPQVQADTQTRPIQLQVETIINVENQIISEENQDIDTENKNTSPTSSVSSNKKLEWDNGADIGYLNSYKLSTKKSASFPSLFPSFQANKLNNQNEEKSLSENKEDLRNMYHQLTFSSEFSCSPPKDSAITSSSTSPPKVQVSSDSSSQSEPKKLISSSSSSNQIPYLQKRIGIPVANSTPYEETPKSQSDDLYRETPLLRALTKPKRNLHAQNNDSSAKTDSKSEEMKTSSDGAVEKELLNAYTEPKRNMNEKSTDIQLKNSSVGNDKKRTNKKAILIQRLNRVQREINLCLTKPVSLECISEESKECVNKLSQTSFSTDLPSKSVQTDILQSRRIIIPDPINVCSPQTQKIEYVKYNSEGREAGYKPFRSDRSTAPSPESKKYGESIKDIEKKIIGEDQSNGGNSKINVGGVKYSTTETGTSTNSSLSTSKKSNSTDINLKQSQNSSESAVEAKADHPNEASEEMLLAEMISLNHSRDLNTDIKRSIDILQKLLKSKKYDRSTKKYYIKKIVQKIVESKYSDDSTTSSELFRPKKPNQVQKDVKLMDNIPWYPAEQPKHNLKKKTKPIECKTTRTEIFPNKKSAELGRTAKSDQILQKPDFKKSSTSRDTQSSDGFVYKNHDFELATTSREKNWKNVKTCSEILLEKKDKVVAKLGQGDYLLHVAKNERQHQLSWINNEIEHLVNLKTLLEKKEKPDPGFKGVISSLLKMKVDDMKADSPFQEGRNIVDPDSNDKAMQSLDEVPSLESCKSAKSSPPQLSKGNDPPFPSYKQEKIQVFMCPTSTSDPVKETPVTKITNCVCHSDTCKCSQTATHEEKKIQCPAFQPCTCQTDPKEDAKVQCCCKVDTGITCSCGMASCQCNDVQSESSPSSSNSGSFMSCVCCKKQKILKNILGKIPLCDPCQSVQQKSFYPHSYNDPLHSCMCYSLLNKGTLFELKNTLTELERLEIYQQYCEMFKNCQCCKKCGCQCMLPKKFKNGCAYFLKLEDAHPNNHGDDDDEECDCEDVDEEGEKVNNLPEVTVKVPNCRAPCSRKARKNSSQNIMSCPSVQTYLCTMKPEFVMRAERRRRILRDAALQREQDVDDRKLQFMQKVKFLNENLQNRQMIAESNANVCGPYGNEAKTYCVFDVKLDDAPKRVQPHVFKSFKEMKELTRRKYLHLNEVKSKKEINREKRLREANRILANTFTRRIQRSTLRGNVDIPPNVKIVTY